MFAIETEKQAEDMIYGEYENACKIYGTTYKDHQEAYQIIQEEFHEAISELHMLKENIEEWDATGFKARLGDIRRYAIQAMMELAQVGAVAMKIENMEDA